MKSLFYFVRLVDLDLAEQKIEISDCCFKVKNEQGVAFGVNFDTDPKCNGCRSLRAKKLKISS